MKVLIVDDEQANRLILQAMLAKSKHEVVEACNGKEAVELFDTHNPDLVLMDVMMPVMDGYEATKEIRRIELESHTTAHVPIIALTANVSEEDRLRSIDVGMDNHLKKPHTYDQLLQVIAPYLQ